MPIEYIDPDDEIIHRKYVHEEDIIAEVDAANHLIHTIVWSIVVLVLLGIFLLALHVYLGLF
jgi:hypothetical protein